MTYKPTNEIIEEEIEDARSKGYDVEPQGEHGYKLERGDDDDDAPRVVQHGSSVEPTCCERPDGAGNAIRGIKISLTVSVTDRDSGADSSGVKSVHISPINNDGGVGIGFFLGGTTKLTEQQRDMTKEGTVAIKYSECIPCSKFHENTVRFRVIVEDMEGNLAVQYVGLTVGQAHFDGCCG